MCGSVLCVLFFFKSDIPSSLEKQTIYLGNAVVLLFLGVSQCKVGLNSHLEPSKLRETFLSIPADFE